MACRQRGFSVRGLGVLQWHHLKGKSRHDLTIGLCCWHHMAIPFPGWSHKGMRDYYGPSLAEGSKAFHLEFGTDAELLEVQNQILAEESVL